MKKNNFEAGLSSYEDIFKASEPEKQENICITNIPPQKLHDFPGHTFKVLDNDDMEELIGLIRKFGIVEPLVARTRQDGEYDTIAGHRRKFAALKLELPAVPVIIRDDLDEEQATILMILSNKHRDSLLPSEKAKSFKALFDIENHQGKRTDLTSSQTAAMLEDAKKTLAEAENMGIRQIQRYIRLTLLTDSLLDLVDENKLAMAAGYELSFLMSESQEIIGRVIQENGKAPSAEQAKEMVKLEKSGSLTVRTVRNMLQKKEKKKTFTLKEEYIHQYFSPEYSKKEIEDIILSLLEDWKYKNVSDMEET